MGWRVAFALGAVAAIFALWARQKMPESPRWLLIKGRIDEAEEVLWNIGFHHNYSINPRLFQTLKKKPNSQIIQTTFYP